MEFRKLWPHPAFDAIRVQLPLRGKGLRGLANSKAEPRAALQPSVFTSPESIIVWVFFFLWGKFKPTQRAFHRAHQTNKCYSYVRPHTVAAGQGLAAWLPLTLKQIVRLKPHAPLGKLWAWPTHWSQSIWKRGKAPLWPGMAIFPKRMRSLQAEDSSCTIAPLWTRVDFLYGKRWLEQHKAGRISEQPCCKSDLSICIWLQKLASKIQVFVHGRKWESNMEALTTVNRQQGFL